MSRSDLCNQWLHSLVVTVKQVKFPQVEDIAPGKAADSRKFRSQVIGQLFGDDCAMFEVSLPFHDHPPNIPVEPDEFGIDRFHRCLLRRTDTLFHLSEEVCIVQAGIIIIQVAHLPLSKTLKRIGNLTACVGPA